ncbi:unnamed protein product [Rotaria socialis]|uniref:NAD(P)(+)--arginine ADP-ribosyltransferase n=2 Tax=Rotaria socialis TaxID=392032 RepID=A0A821LKB4_9BILA|nr:unnamed protein product [Rotaria socialis]
MFLDNIFSEIILRWILFSDRTPEPIITMSQSSMFDATTAESISLLQGYRNMPLVSLEDATLALQNIIPDIKDMVCTAKMNCRKPGDNLTSDQSASIMLLNMNSLARENSFRYFLNEALRSNSEQQLKPWFLYLKLLFDGLSKINSKRCTVHRGVNANMLAQYPAEFVFVLSKFMSCTEKFKTLDDEHGFINTGTRTLFSIECSSGKDISKHSFNCTDDEILLLPGTQFQVHSSLNTGDEFYIIKMVEITSP